MMGFGLIWMLIFWGGLIALAVWLIRVLFPASPYKSADNVLDTPVSARDILDQRYARGELSREEYEEMRQAIGSQL